MSGICGIVASDGKPISDAELGGMLAALSLRGPDRSGVWLQGGRALGHALLATTPESLTEKLPCTHEMTGCVITADVRLDNREDLIDALGLINSPAPFGDGELILHAYLKWGASCPDHLLGDFAFAIWDPRDELLFCARDLIGMRQLLYHHNPGKLFALATEAEAILQHPEIPLRVNQDRIADYLEDLEAYDLTSTFFHGLHRLPPGHAMTLHRKDLRIWKYGKLARQSTLRLASDEAYAEAFRDKLTEAVRTRLRSPQPVGSMLSGGMDSGSVAAIAAHLLEGRGQAPLQTFSAVGTDARCQETRAIIAAQSIEHVDVQSMSVRDLSRHSDELAALVRSASDPFDGHMTLIYAVYLMAHNAGKKVVLDGVGGDTTLGTQNMIAWHLRKGNPFQAWSEATGQERFWDHPEPALRNFLKSLMQVGIPAELRNLRHAIRQKRAQKRLAERTLIAPDFARETRLAERLQANAQHVAHPAGDSHGDRERRILHPYVTVARERYDRVSSALAIEPRDPFLDRRVMEFCLSLPADQLQRDGWPKFILRNALDGRLPHRVLWRSGKEHLGWDFTKALWQERLRISGYTPSEKVSRFVKSSRLPQTRSACENESELATILAIQYLENWISTRGESIT